MIIKDEHSRVLLPVLLILAFVGLIGFAQTTTDTSGRTLRDVSGSSVAVTNEVDVTGQIGVTGSVTVADGISINVTNTVATSGGATGSSNVLTSVTNTPSVTITGDALTALQLIDDFISGSEGQVDVVTFPDNVTLSVTNTVTTTGGASNSTNVQLGASTAAIGKLAANNGVDIGDVDVLSLPADIEVSATNVVQVGDNSSSLTVDNAGTFAVQVDGDALTALQLIDNFISGSEGQVDVVTLPADIVVSATNIVVADVTGQGDVPITLDGEAVTANLGATDNAVLDAIELDTTGTTNLLTTIDADTSTLAGAVSGSEMQVDLVDLNGAATAANQSTANTSLSNIDTNTGVLTNYFSPFTDLTTSGQVYSNVVKSSAGQVHGLYVANTNSTPIYAKLYNVASAFNPPDNGPVAIFIIPGNTSGAGNNVMIPLRGLHFSTGIGIGLTGAPATNDSTSVTGVLPVTVVYD